MNINYLRLFLVVFSLLNFTLSGQDKKDAVKSISQQQGLDLNEAETYYNFRKKLIIHPNADLASKNNSANCVAGNNQNIGFELGNYSGWDINKGTIINSLYDSIVNISPATTTKTLVTTGFDFLTNYSYNSPFSGNKVILLNDPFNNAEATFMSTKFVVTPSNNILKTAVSFVSQKAGHYCQGEPYFRVQLFSCGRTNLIKQYLVIPNEGTCEGFLPGFFTTYFNQNSNYQATDWKKMCFDLRDYIGQEVEVNVIVSDCIFTGHFGYAYFDAEFGYLPSNVSLSSTFSVNSSVFTYSLGTANQCFNSPGILQGQNVSSISYPPPGLFGTYSTTANSSISFSQQGIYNITQTPTIGCEFPADIKLNVQPTVSIVAPSQTICPNSSVVFTVSGSKQYTIKVNGIVDANITAPNVYPSIIMPLITQNPSTITVIGTGFAGCVDSASVVVSVFPQTSLSVVYTPTVCAGNTTMSASGAVTYTWNGSIISPTYNAYVSNATSIAVVGTNSLGCKTAVSQFSVLGVYGTGVTVSSYSNVVCAGDSVLISVNSANSYTWSNGFTGCCQYLKPTLTSPNYTVAASGMCNPTTNFSIPFTVQTSPAPNSFTVNYPSPVCASQNFTVQGVGANFYMKWGSTGQYNNNVTAFVTNANPTFTAIALGNNGCNTNSVITIPLLPTPTLAISGSTAICSGQSASLSALGANSYTWDYFQASNTYTTNAATNNFNVVLTGTNSVGCSTTNTFPIIVEKPGITATPNTTSVCLGANTITLSATDLGSGGTYSWSTGATTQSIIVTPTVTTAYSVMINSPICGASIYSTTINVIQSSLPVLSYSLNPQGICLNNTTTLTVSGANSYTMGSMFSSSYTNTLSLTPNNSMTAFIVGVTGTYTNGCSTYTLLSFPISQQPYIGIYSTPGNYACKNSTMTLTANDLNTPNALTYLWSTSATGSVAVITPSVNMTYSVVGTAANGCTNSATSAMIYGVNPPTITITPPTPSICPNSVFTLSASVVGGSGFTWNGSSTGATYSSSVNTPTVYSVTSSTNFCSVTKTIQINIHNPVTFSLTSPVCSGNINVITYSATPPGGTLFINSVATNTIFSNITNTYNLNYMYQDTGNCILSANSTVTISPRPCVKIAVSNYTSCVGSQVTFTGTPAGGFYSSNVIGNSLALSAIGNYTASYTYSDANNCSNTVCTEINASICTDIKTNELKLVNIYPNPSRNAVTIDNPNSAQMILKIYDISGRMLADKQLEGTANIIDISVYSNGLYIFYLESDSNRRFVKVIKE